MQRSYAPTMISTLIVGGFIAVMFVWLTRPIPNMTEGGLTVLNQLVGALTLAFGQVISYWLGSSAGSKTKDGVIETLSK
jgi:uncharacterized membrane-anchored protein YitT (DUF2179 family)